jgi:arginine-tRNA-protein transferase
MSVIDYQKLMDRGWRRCGTYYYKFDFENSCCQPYTIRLDTQEYQISASQKKVMKRFNKFLLGEIDMEGKSTVNNEEVKTGGEKMIVDQDQKASKKSDEDSQKKVAILETLTIICG